MSKRSKTINFERRKSCQKRKRIVEKLKNAIPNMSDFDKGYILGKTESFSENKSDDPDQKETKKGANYE